MRKKNIYLDTCTKCGYLPCRCPSSSSADEPEQSHEILPMDVNPSSLSRASAAIEILIFKPRPSVDVDKRGVHENLRLKQRVKQYLSVGIYTQGSQLQYYFFDQCDQNPKIYDSLALMKKDLPSELKDIFENQPKLFIMGHGHGGFYGLCNKDDKSELIYDNFDDIIRDFQEASSQSPQKLTITLEACDTDNQALAKEQGQSKTFLERLSATHKDLTFCGTGPWSEKDPATGFRSSGGYPELTVPVTSIGGGIWKHGNSVIFHHDEHQLVAIKSKFASTQSTKALKINTVDYAREFLHYSQLSTVNKEALMQAICSSRQAMKISDLDTFPSFPQEKINNKKLSSIKAKENTIIQQEKSNYLTRVQSILLEAKSNGEFSDRDALVITLGLKDWVEQPEQSVFQGHDDLVQEILSNQKLLQLVMVSCGKALIAGPSNDKLIDFLVKKQHIDSNCTDAMGMTALHYAVQNFYNYRQEPLRLVQKILDSGADINFKNHTGQTPLEIAKQHAKKSTVMNGDELIAVCVKSNKMRVPWTELRGQTLFSETTQEKPDAGNFIKFVP